MWIGPALLCALCSVMAGWKRRLHRETTFYASVNNNPEHVRQLALCGQKTLLTARDNCSPSYKDDKYLRTAGRLERSFW